MEPAMNKTARTATVALALALALCAPPGRAADVRPLVTPYMFTATLTVADYRIGTDCTAFKFDTQPAWFAVRYTAAGDTTQATAQSAILKIAALRDAFVSRRPVEVRLWDVVFPPQGDTGCIMIDGVRIIKLIKDVGAAK
jgi:hypothetical protein